MAENLVSNGPTAGNDPFFEIIFDTEWNACVGTQGDELNYVDGYIEAALELVSAVIDKNLIGSRDTLAMPILFNSRHAIELSLKFAINQLHRIGMVARPHRADHDIQSHWAHLRDAKVGDFTIRSLIDDLEPFVLSLAKIDDDGQELRYAENRDGQKSLREVAIVNLLHIQTSLVTLRKILTALKYRLIDLGLERSTGSHTKDCSRRDLRDIATRLGAHSSWHENEFLDKKAAIRKDFGLSSGKFSDAVDKIRASRELAALVGIETALSYISDEKIIVALELWVNARKRRVAAVSDSGTDYTGRSMDKIFDEMIDHAQANKTLCEGIHEELTAEDFCDLEVLFYMGRGQEFGEFYEEILAKTMPAYQTRQSHSERVYHIMSKTNLLDSVVKGSRAAGRPSLAEKLSALQPAG